MLDCADLIVSGPQLHLTGLPHRFEAEAVKAGGPVGSQPRIVLVRAVAFVSGEAEFREDAIPLAHTGVTSNFREDRCGRDALAPGVSTDQRLLLDPKIDCYGVDQEVIRAEAEKLHRSSHGEPGSLQNVDTVDLESIGSRNSTARTPLADALGEDLTDFRVEFFTVPQSADRPCGIENDRSGINRAEQSSSADLVDTGNTAEAALAG
jgi:hypothetical protein